MEYEQYEHHGILVTVRSDLKGRHREFCLCYQCGRFDPGKEDNCYKAQGLYELNKDHGLVTPVFECPDFVPWKQ